MSGLIDYAGLFPPAGCGMSEAVRNFANYRNSDDSWILGRFVCGAFSLQEFRKALNEQRQQSGPQSADGETWKLTVVASGQTAQSVATDMYAVDQFNSQCAKDDVRVAVDCYEVKCTTPDIVKALSAEIPSGLNAYMEVPLSMFSKPSASNGSADESSHFSTDTIIAAISAAGRRAKIRMGGVTASAFPDASDVAGFLQSCISHNVVAKATAGLHHPIGGVHRLTYEDRAEAGQMFGFLNLFLAATLLAGGATTETAVVLLNQADTNAFAISANQIEWRSADDVCMFDSAALDRVRQTLLVSFGSCSFLEPVSESRALGLLPHPDSRPV